MSGVYGAGKSCRSVIFTGTLSQGIWIDPTAVQLMDLSDGLFEHPEDPLIAVPFSTLQPEMGTEPDITRF